MKNKLNGAMWDSLFLTSTKLTAILMGIVITRILSVSLSLQEYGSYSQLLLIISITSSAIMLGMGDTINFFFNQEKTRLDEETRIQYVNTIYSVELFLGLLAALVVFAFQKVIAGYFSNNDLIPYFIFIIWKPMLENVLSLYNILFVSVGKAKLIAMRNLIISILKTIIVLVATQVFKELRIIFMLLVLMDIGQLFIFNILFRKIKFSVNPFKGKLKLIKSIVLYGIPMGIYSITNSFTRDLDKLIIGRFATTETLAIYTNCSKQLPFDIVATSLITVMIPYIVKFISSQDLKKARKLYSEYFRIGYYTVWIMGACAIIFSSNLVNILYSEKYISGLPIFIIYVFDSMIRFAGMHLILTSNGQAKKIMLFSLISLCLDFILNIALYPVLGVIGPAISTLIVAFVYVTLIVRSSLKILNCRIINLINIKEVFVFLILIVSSGVLCHYGFRLLVSVNVPELISMAIAAILFCGVNFLLQFKNITNSMKVINSFRLD